MLNDLKNISAAYSTKFIIYFVFVITFLLLTIRYPLNLIIAGFVFFSGILLYIFIIKARNEELRKIGEVISNISSQVYASSNEIQLDKSMSLLEDKIRRMYEKARTDVEYLKKLEKVRTEFIANVSHELKTPIFTIQGYLETLIDGAINDEKVRLNFLQKANHYTVTLSSLVNDLIDLSMIEAGELRMSFRYFKINDFIRSILPDFQNAAKEKNIELEFIAANDKLEVFGDKNRLSQVINNLLSNAVKYTDKGKIEILIEEGSKEAQIIIRDTGIGIPEEDLTRIFERFYRVDKARSRDVGGTGLGLSISRHIIEAHGSKISVKSTLNEGSEFFFSLKK